LWDGDKQKKADEPFYYRPFEGTTGDGNLKWCEPEQIPMETSSLCLGTTIAFKREDQAKHWKDILDSMRENIQAIGRSNLNITQKLHAIRQLELPRIDFRMMYGDLYRPDLRRFDSWMRGQIMGWLQIQGIATEVFQMSCRDRGFTLPSLKERQHTMVIRTILDMMRTTDRAA
jgi:hypothetical protein